MPKIRTWSVFHVQRGYGEHQYHEIETHGCNSMRLVSESLELTPLTHKKFYVEEDVIGGPNGT